MSSSPAPSKTYTLRKAYSKNYVVKHGCGWRYKRRVPQELQAILGGKKVWLSYLGDIPRAEAERRARKIAVGHDDLIGRLRKLSSADSHSLANAGGLSEVTIAADDRGAVFVEALALHTEINALDTEEDQALQALEIVRARKAAAQMRADAAKARSLLAKVEGRTLDGVESLIPVWMARNKPRSGDATMRRHVRRFIAVVGDLPARAVTRTHVAVFRDALEANPALGRPAVGRHLSDLHTLFKAALSANVVDHNPAVGVTVSKRSGKFSDETRKMPFSAEQVRAILTAAEYEHADTQWVLRLLAYTGARSGELAQLRVDDVACLEGIWCLRIHDRHGPLKNKFSVRDIPIPPACMEIVDYAKTVKGPWLFGTFEQWASRSRGATFQHRVGKWLRDTVGIKDPSLTLHSFRHRWRTVAREIDMPEPVSRALMGHSMGSGDHSAYGSVVSLAKRAEWIGRVDPLA